MEYTSCPSKRTKDYWTYLEENYQEVRNWPTWMRGEATPPSEQANAHSEGSDGQPAAVKSSAGSKSATA